MFRAKELWALPLLAKLELGLVGRRVLVLRAINESLAQELHAMQCFTFMS